MDKTRIVLTEKESQKIYNQLVKQLKKGKYKIEFKDSHYSIMYKFVFDNGLEFIKLNNQIIELNHKNYDLLPTNIYESWFCERSFSGALLEKTDKIIKKMEEYKREEEQKDIKKEIFEGIGIK